MHWLKCLLKAVSQAIFIFPAFISFGQDKPVTVIVHYAPTPVNSFIPAETFGVGYDGHEKGDNENILQNVQQMFSVNMKPLTYRLRTELGMEVWHWNPKGTWSESSKKQGYWTSSSDPSSNISLSYGYKLPRRGNSIDQANNDGYSRITDGNVNTFWKSNPYLDEYYTKQPNQKHAQWMIIDLGDEKMINAIRILWGLPYALSYTVDYALPPVYEYFDNAGYFEIDSPQIWKPFPNHVVVNKNRSAPVLLSDKPMKIRFVRIRMSEGSRTAPKGSNDIRDSLGFAIKEFYAGTVDKMGRFTDIVHHSKNRKKQSQTYTSSTDPWHRASDIDSLTEQLGIDRTYKIGLNRNLPALLPVGLLYDTPENVAALTDYVQKKKYPVDGIELGEEPDGQEVNPEDAAELYNQFSKKILRKHPQLKLGGPSLQNIILSHNDEMLPTKQWMERFTNYVSQYNSKGAFKFFSFEWYAFDSVCALAAPQLLRQPQKLEVAMEDMRQVKGLQGIPFYITEYGYSAFAGINEVAIQGALMNADIVGQFLTLGGNRAYLYGWEPNNLQSDFGCSPGNNMLFGMNDDGRVIYKVAAYYGAKMITDYWAQTANQSLEVFPATSDLVDKYNQQLISVYALKTKDNKWSLLLINKDEVNEHTVKIEMENQKNNGALHFTFPALCYQYSGKQYEWKADGLKGHPVKSLPPEEKTINQNSITLPPFSLTVIREK